MISRNFYIVSLLLVVVGLPASTANAITIVLKSSGKTIRAKLVREYATGMVVDEVQPDGAVVRRDISRSDVELMLDPIDKERLTTLAPENAQSYRIYAEELAEKKADPDAREMAIRLYLIAAHLEPKTLGKSSLLGMSALARNAPEERRFRAMVYLVDSKHDRRMLELSRPKETPAAEPTDSSAARVIQAMRYLRRGKLKEAKNLSRREGFKEVLAKHDDLLTFDDFESASNPRCPQCSFGKETCPTCSGSGRVDGNRCRTCFGRKTITCQRCEGNYKEPPLDNSLLKKVIMLELRMSGESTIAEAVSSGDEEESLPWSKLIRDGGAARAPSLRLESVTEFDPRKNVYRNGEWKSAE